MKKISELIEPSNDAIDYLTRKKREFFTKSYVKTSSVDRVLEQNCYYIIGEKGSGKTALAMFVQNSSPDEITGKLQSISETQYRKFIYLKLDNKLIYSDYAQIWRPTLLYLMSKLLVEKGKKWTHRITRKFSTIEKAIKDYDSKSLIPELESVHEFIDSLTRTSDVEAKHPAIKGRINDVHTVSDKTSRKEMCHNLLEVEKKLKEGLEALKLDKDFVLFLDGIDARPSGIDQEEYLACLKGLTDAAWHINTDFFQNIRDTKGRMRVVCLLRPDVFNSLDIYNSNSRISDNSAILDWSTTEDRYRNSDLFSTMNRYFSSQESNRIIGWDDYFPEKNNNGYSKGFTTLLRKSFQRPRDYFTAIKILIQQYKRNGNGQLTNFNGSDFDKAEFTDQYATYLLGEVKNYANFYMSNEDFDKYVKFFQYMDGKSDFEESDFIAAFDAFKEWALKQNITSKEVLSTHDSFLQFWYDVNVIGHIETPDDGSSPFVHWSYRDRSMINVMPKVKSGTKYKINPGISKSLDIGKRFKKRTAINLI
jgi:hypothetical protein